MAKAQKKLMAQVIAAEYGTEVSKREIPVFTQSGDNRYENADKMILKGVAVLPHGRSITSRPSSATGKIYWLNTFSGLKRG